MDDLTLINNTSVYRNPAPQSPLQGANVLYPPAVYSKIMLRTIELSSADMVFDNLATERNMPSNNGSNEITFKRMLSLAAHTQPLVEGIPPASDQGRMTAIKASTQMYGRVMKFTDKVNWAVPDDLISEYTRQLALKVPETKDILAQEALLSECQMFYAQPKTSHNDDPDVLYPASGSTLVSHITHMHPSCAPTIDEFRKIVLSMEASKVRPYQGSNFLVLASPAVLYDLITDKRVKEFMKYENTARAYTTDMVIDLFSLAFKKAKTIKADNTYTDANGAIKYLYFDGKDAYSLNKPLAEHTPNSADFTAEEGETQTIFTVANVGGKVTRTQVKKLSGSDKILGTAEPMNVHYSFVLGDECLFRIGIEGHTQPQFIHHEPGSAGTDDPLDQRQSIGWKLDSLGYKVPNPDAVVAYVSIPTQYRLNFNARPDFKNQFTDYDYGFEDEFGNYFYPEQVSEFGGVYNVRGTSTEVHPVKMTKLVKPVRTGRVQADGQMPIVTGAIPTTGRFFLKSSLDSQNPITFNKDQVAKHSNNLYYIKGLEGQAPAEVVMAPADYTKTVPTGDGSAMVDKTATMEGPTAYNDTGDARIDK